MYLIINSISQKKVLYVVFAEPIYFLILNECTKNHSYAVCAAANKNLRREENNCMPLHNFLYTAHERLLTDLLVFVLAVYEIFNAQKFAELQLRTLTNDNVFKYSDEDIIQCTILKLLLCKRLRHTLVCFDTVNSNKL